MSQFPNHCCAELSWARLCHDWDFSVHFSVEYRPVPAVQLYTVMWHFCQITDIFVHMSAHSTRSGQLNPGIGDYSDAFPIIKFRNFVFVGILTSRQLAWSTANKWTQIAQWNSAHLELLMGVRWVYVLTLEPHNIWICCNSCIRAISSGLQNGLYSAVQWVRSLYTCTELQGRCCSQARTRAYFWTDDWWSMGVRI